MLTESNRVGHRRGLLTSGNFCASLSSLLRKIVLYLVTTVPARAVCLAMSSTAVRRRARGGAPRPSPRRRNGNRRERIRRDHLGQDDLPSPPARPPARPGRGGAFRRGAPHPCRPRTRRTPCDRGGLTDCPRILRKAAGRVFAPSAAASAGIPPASADGRSSFGPSVATEPRRPRGRPGGPSRLGGTHRTCPEP